MAARVGRVSSVVRGGSTFTSGSMSKKGLSQALSDSSSH